jgi:hypothetical protein
MMTIYLLVHCVSGIKVQGSPPIQIVWAHEACFHRVLGLWKKRLCASKFAGCRDPGFSMMVVSTLVFSRQLAAVDGTGLLPLSCLLLTAYWPSCFGLRAPNHGLGKQVHYAARCMMGQTLARRLLRHVCQFEHLVSSCAARGKLPQLKRTQHWAAATVLLISPYLTRQREGKRLLYLKKAFLAFQHRHNTAPQEPFPTKRGGKTAQQYSTLEF